jgi:hypothetical protein
MTKKTYSEKLKDPRWQKKRLKILERDGWACTECPCKTDTLHVHHKKYNGNPWDASDEDLCTLCEGCHELEEYLKTEIMLFKFAKKTNKTCIHIWKIIGTVTFMELNSAKEYEFIRDKLNEFTQGKLNKDYLVHLTSTLNG